MRFLSTLYKVMPERNGYIYREDFTVLVTQNYEISVSIGVNSRTGKQHTSNVAFLSVEEAEALVQKLNTCIQNAKGGGK